jgi:hypothetical protein
LKIQLAKIMFSEISYKSTLQGKNFAVQWHLPLLQLVRGFTKPFQGNAGQSLKLATVVSFITDSSLLHSLCS